MIGIISKELVESMDFDALDQLAEQKKEADRKRIAWLKTRLGVMTSSKASKLLSKRKGVLNKFVSEKVNEEFLKNEDFTPTEEWKGQDVINGQEWEKYAIERFEKETGIILEYTNDNQKLFIHPKYKYIGGTPDGLGHDIERAVERVKVVNETKCPKRTTHIFYLTNILTPSDLKSLERDYYNQILSNMIVCGADVGYFVSYCYLIPKKDKQIHIVKIPKSEVLGDMQELEESMRKANTLKIEMMEIFGL